MLLSRGRRLVIGALAVALLAGAAVWLAQAGFARATDGPVRFDPAFFLGPKMARAEVVMVLDGQTHDFRIDRGRVRANTNGVLAIREKDGTVVQIAVSPTARIILDGRPARLAAIKPRYAVQTIRDGDQPAYAVRAASPR